jgi:cyclopropane-fatty-acyl-phospholipid synthase
MSRESRPTFPAATNHTETARRSGRWRHPIHFRPESLHSPSHVSDAILTRCREAATLLFGQVEEREFAVRYWDQHLEERGGGIPARYTLTLSGPSALRRMFLPPSELRLAAAFVRGDFDVEGDLEAATALRDELRARLTTPGVWPRLLACLAGLPRAPARLPAASGPAAASLHGRRHSIRRDAAAVRSHYDVGNDFYRLWLDRELVYSCAYFRTGQEDIDTAQRDKMEHICRKLRLRPGERLLDIGCGWGGLLRHAVRQFGVEGLGITLSEEQARWARQRIAEEGLAGRCRVEVRDYRELPDDAQFDKVVSVGMVEHVGLEQLPAYFARAFRLTRPGGVFLNHGITGSLEASTAGVVPRIVSRVWDTGSFMQRYVFPDGELPPLDRIVGAARNAGFEVRDVETLREHYARTLRRWRQRLERARAAVTAVVGDETFRTWRLYMAGCARSFASGYIDVAQTVLGRPDANGHVSLPLTRADLYAGLAEGAGRG